MHKWQCPYCNGWISSAFERNLKILVQDHKAEHQRLGDKICLTLSDVKFLQELKVAW